MRQEVLLLVLLLLCPQILLLLQLAREVVDVRLEADAVVSAVGEAGRLRGHGGLCAFEVVRELPDAEEQAEHQAEEQAHRQADDRRREGAAPTPPGGWHTEGGV